METPAPHRWKFFRAGGVDQVMFRDGADLAHLGELDPKLWVALAMPSRGIELDPKTADLIDTDHDGRIRPPELIAAVQWVAGALRDVGDVLRGGDGVALAAIQEPGILAAARRVLAELGKGDASAITLADVADTATIFATTQFNGDGVVVPESADDPATRQAITEIIATLGGQPDRSGKVGVDQVTLDAFFTQAAAHCAWAARAADPGLAPLGEEATAAAAAAVEAVRGKVDDYFARLRLATFDGRATAALNLSEKDYLALAAKELTLASAEIATLVLAKIVPDAPLPLTDGLNPAWTGAIATLASQAIAPLLGERDALSEADWSAVQAKLAPFVAWQAAKPASAVAQLGTARLHELLAGPARDAITALIQQDAALAPEYAQIAAVEKLVRFQRDLGKVLANYVNFADFYGRRGAVFQAGTLYLDARGCTLCIEVADAAKHATLAGLAGAYLAYCDLSRPGGQKRSIVAVFTDGDSDNLMVGRNGVFYDRQGCDWDATITRIVANPIGLREAFWLPYKKLVRMIEEQVSKRAAAAEAPSISKMTQVATTVGAADKAAPEAAKAKKIDVGTVAALGVAVGAIGTAIASVATGLMELAVWQYPVVIAAVWLAISGPSMLLAWLKLRRRNLGPILDANGWAINTKARLNVPFGAALTGVAKLPAGAERSLADPFADKRRPWKSYLFVVAVLVLGGLWYAGRLDPWLPLDQLTSTHLLGDHAPAAHHASPTPPTSVTPPPAAP
ncbi:MAG: hypothetical protein COW73_03915 [Nitrospirae bacterium CG18_big_fil_WC_8_21_14_2_50_70_55]|nr:hypothetical protein [Deltaproteobacteria bacterium]OIP64859.1 MAG: hypothetical protein AUK30_05895 [Nitrospirae bacterium CG2_30_70_394]PIQ06187.1 MAG: hypothetical protein COW73_03915 [Nitrospirae bacterium CG18_big_fil_WC_8_21_14_2_50_70_55]PIU80239.1 MAG: hypothetical protein COS73_00335 [Nitrospirae bacterium CG06_land_8_20_14_3_00_70_43]PIW83113.1 MAG: hypothetical protein COZ96_05055 [Nitrospirae bacterium CG_4_8_14_3_um_filter_70_85]PIX83981.1 MAG: hypothetical protein COZ33_02660 